MRKNIFNTVAGILVAVSMLFAAIGCTNINDPETLKKDSFTVNKMAITGFKVTGLNGNYDHATVQLKTGTVVIAEGVIADEEESLTPGTAFVKLETPYIFDAGEHEPKDFECYLEVVKSGVSIGKVEAVDADDLSKTAPAKLPIIASPYGTKDADLAKRFVEVVVANDVGTFSFAEELSASLRFSYTALPEMTGPELLALKEADGVKVETKAKADAEFATYKIIVNNLENDPDGMRYVVCGATIGSTKATAGDHWNAYADNNADEGLISVVEDGSVEFNFVGKEPSWNPGKGVAIKIAAIDDPMKSDPWLCLLAAPNNGNFCIPCDKDYTITIDAKKLNAEYKFSAVKERFVKVMNLTVVGKQLKEIKEAEAAKYLAFCEGWLPGNEWGATTPNKVSLNDITVVGEVGTATLSLGNGVDFWAGEPYTYIDMPMQILYPEDDVNGFWNNKLMASGFKVYFEDQWIGKAVNIIYNLDTGVVTYESGAFILIEDIQLVNYTGAATEVFFLEGWVPDNKWGADTPNKANVVSGSATCTLSSPAKITDEKFVIQIVNLKPDFTEFGDSWQNVDKIEDGSTKVTNPLDLETYTLKFDCSTKTLTLVKNNI